MTPHRHWLCNYTPKRVAIKLADNAVVYSAGVGTVVFNPVIAGKSGQAVEFSNVLHVPELRNNNLAVLYLTRHSSFVVHINAIHVTFSCGSGPPLFVISMNSHNTAFLDGTTEPVTQYAHPTTTIPLDLALQHCRFTHQYIADIKHLFEYSMVTGMKLNSKSLPDPTCKPCLAGKMSANPFSSSTSCSTHPLELVHSAVHQVPYPIFSGIAIGSLSLMTIQDIISFCPFIPNWTYLTLLNSLRHLQRTSIRGRSKHCTMTREESI